MAARKRIPLIKPDGWMDSDWRTAYAEYLRRGPLTPADRAHLDMLPTLAARTEWMQERYGADAMRCAAIDHRVAVEVNAKARRRQREEQGAIQD